MTELKAATTRPVSAGDRLETIFEGMGAAGALAHVRALDDAWARLLRGERPPSPISNIPHADLPAPDLEADVVTLGAGLGLLHALALQRRGWRVLLVDRRAIGRTHREWNITRGELESLFLAGTLDRAAIERAVAREYRRGILRFHDPAGAPLEIDLPGVLDLALDSTALLGAARDAFEVAGGQLLEGATFEHLWSASDGRPRICVRLETPDGPLTVGARLAVNAMGALSPLTLALAGPGMPLDGVCPTVGTVARGFAVGEVDPTVGEILVTTGGAVDGRQLIWEGFPAHDDTLTTYLFYYDTTRDRAADPHSLEALFESYFATLADYKQPGPDFEHLRPVYGFIPARHHLGLRPSERARVGRGVLSIGDAAARQNPLTFTGFGAFVREFPRAIYLLDALLRDGEPEAKALVRVATPSKPIGAMWVLARFLGPREDEDDVNAILRDFTRALAELDPAAATDFFLDRAGPGTYVELMLRTARHRPAVFKEAFEVLGARGVLRWMRDLVAWVASIDNR